MESGNPKILNQLKLLQILFCDMGTLMKNLGNEEKKNNEKTFFKSFGKDSRSFLTEISNDLTAEELGKLMKLLIKLSSFGTNLQNFLSLESDDKITIGDEINSLAIETQTLIDNISNRIKQ